MFIITALNNNQSFNNQLEMKLESKFAKLPQRHQLPRRAIQTQSHRRKSTLGVHWDARRWKSPRWFLLGKSLWCRGADNSLAWAISQSLESVTTAAGWSLEFQVKSDFPGSKRSWPPLEASGPSSPCRLPGSLPTGCHPTGHLPRAPASISSGLASVLGMWKAGGSTWTNVTLYL